MRINNPSGSLRPAVSGNRENRGRYYRGRHGGVPFSGKVIRRHPCFENVGFITCWRLLAVSGLITDTDAPDFFVKLINTELAG